MNTALLVIDVQESFRQRPLWQAVSIPDLLAKVDTLVAAARADGDFVAWVLHAEPGGDGVFDPANGHVRLMDELTVADGEPVLVKTSYNAFTSTNLQQLLTKRGIRQLRVCGMRSEQCVETTARVGHDLGFDVTYVVDATATFPIPHRDAPDDLTIAELLADPRTRQAEDVIAAVEYALAGRFATVATVADVTGATLTTS